MPRPQRELDPDGGPLVELAAELRALRDQAGTPKFAAMSRRTGRSKTALAEAAGGRHLPRWETVDDFVRACGGDPAVWRPRWEQARAAVASSAPAGNGGAPTSAEDLPRPTVIEAADPEPADEPAGSGRPDTVGGDHPSVGREPVGGGATDAEPAAAAPARSAADPRPDPAPHPAPDSAPDSAPHTAPAARSRRPLDRRLVFAAGLVAGLLVAGLGVAAVLAVPSAEPVITQNLRVVEVQNKVAIGPSELTEDSTPAYLSSAPIAYCASPSRSCKVPGTEMASGAAIVANCWTHGQRMVNFDLAEEASRTNPHRADSDLWYRAAFPDGRSGYLSEVYVNGEDRGGLGLPSCGPG